MYKNGRFINAGECEFYRYGKKAVSMVQAGLIANENGYCSIPVDGGKFYTIGTSIGRYGEFAKYGSTCFPVNQGGYIYAKVGTEKYAADISMLTGIIEEMNKKNNERTIKDDGDEEYTE